MAKDGVHVQPQPKSRKPLYDHELPWWKRRRSWLWIAIAVAVLWTSSHFLGFGFTVGTVVIILTVVGVVALWMYLGWRIGLAVLLAAIVIPLFLNLCHVWAFSDLRPRLFNRSQVAAVVTQKPEPSHEKTKVQDRKSTPTQTVIFDQPPLINNPIGLDGPDVPVAGAKAPAAPATEVAAAPPPIPVPTPAKADPAPAKAKEEPKSAQAATPAPAKVTPPKAPTPDATAQASPPASVLVAASKPVARKPARAISTRMDLGTGLPLLNKGLTGPNSNLHLIALLQVSFDRDPTGNTPLTESLCTTPRMYLDALRIDHADVGLPDFEHGGFQRMIEYIRTWQLAQVDAEMAGDYYTSRIVRPPSGSGCAIEAGWAGGKLRVGEMVYVDRNTHEVVARNNCGNIMGKRKTPVMPKVAFVPPPLVRCPVIRAFTHYGDQVMQHIRLTPNGRVEASGACPFMFKRPGDTRWYDFPTECPHGPCDFSLTIDSSGGLLPGPSGGVNVLHAPGGYEFQVPWEWVNNKDVIFAFCLTVESGEHSCAKDIRTADYTDGVAIVGYGDPGEVPLGWKGHERIWCLPKTVNGHCEFCPK